MEGLSRAFGKAKKMTEDLRIEEEKSEVGVEIDGEERKEIEE